MKISLIEEILLEWSLSVDSGVPDINKQEDLFLLKEVLENKFKNEPKKNEIIMGIMNVLQEEENEKPKEEPKPKEKPKDEKPASEEPKSDVPNSDVPPPPSDSEETPSSDTSSPSPSSGNEAPAGKEPSKTNNEEPPKEEPKEEPQTEKPDTTQTDVAMQNMKNAELSGLYFYRPSSEYVVAPGTQNKFEVEGIYELQNGALMMKVGADEHQINRCPYTGYIAAIQLPKLDKELMKKQQKIQLKPSGGEEGEPSGGEGEPPTGEEEPTEK